MRFVTRQQTTSNILEETDRPNVVRTPTFYADLGFTLYATSGTGSVISEAGIPVNILPKLASGQSPNVIDLMKNKDMALVIRAPNDKNPREDEVKIRTAAMQNRIPTTIALHIADAALKSAAKTPPVAASKPSLFFALLLTSLQPCICSQSQEAHSYTTGTVVAWDWIGGQTTSPAGLRDVIAIAVGTSHTIALKADGTVSAWWNRRGFFDLGQIAAPKGLSGVTAVAAGSGHTVVLKGDGTVVAWGYNAQGQTAVPEGLSGVTAISAAANGLHTVALKSDGTVMAWGDNSQGQTAVPEGLKGVTAISAGGSHTVALKSDGTVVAWGGNKEGQTDIPEGLKGVTAISAGGSHTVALKSDGTVVAWGGNKEGQTDIPEGLKGVTAISAGGSHTVALKSDGTVVAMGYYGFGQMNVPVGLGGVVAIAAGSGHTEVLVADGRSKLQFGLLPFGEYAAALKTKTRSKTKATLSSGARFLFLDENGRIGKYHLSLPSDLRANSPSQVAAVGRITRSEKPAGKYSNGEPASIGVDTVKIVDPVRRVVIVEKAFSGDNPPKVITKPNSGPGSAGVGIVTTPDLGKLDDWLRSLRQP